MIKKILYILFSIFLLVGVCLVSVGFLIAENISIPFGREKKTTAIITRIERVNDLDYESEHEVFVEYEVDGQSYEKELNAYSSDYRVGKKIDVVYDKEDPENVTVPWIKTIVLGAFCGIGGFFAFVGLLGIIITSRVGFKKKSLIEKGDLVYAKFVRVKENNQVYVNGRNPFQIVCEWTDPETGDKYTYESEFIYEDPRYKLEGKSIGQIPVYVDYKNKYRYYVDISQLLGE